MLKIAMYPKATENRLHGNDQSVRGARRRFLKAASLNFLIFQLLFLGLFAYIFGALFQQGGHVHNMNVLYVDYDGGVIGTSIRDAYDLMKGDAFPTLQEKSSSRFPTPQDIERQVCSTRYWGALYTSPGASNRLTNALSGGPAATEYNHSNVLTYVWNEARYSAIIDTTISADLKNLASTARIAYMTRNGTAALQLLSPGMLNYETSVSILADPWQLSDVNIQPTTQGSRLIYNTLVIILILIQEFFYLGTINGLYAQVKLYARLHPRRLIIYRNLISLSYTLVGSLCTTGAIWAFRVKWQVNGNQFVLSWIVLWLFAHANFSCMDVLTVWVPMQYVPLCLITWIVCNVTSILVPFELSPGFYKWGYAMPAHEVYQALVDIWSRGCNPQLYHALPILFVMELLGLLLSALGVYRRCHYAIIAEEVQEHAFQERLEGAMAFERKRDEEREKTMDGIDDNELQKVQTVKREREDLVQALRREETQLQREKTKASRACGFGPSFDLPFVDENPP